VALRLPGIKVEAQPAPGGAVSAGCRRGLVACHASRCGILATVMVALVTFCLLGFASVGLLYLPAAVALVIAVIGWRQSAPPQWPTTSQRTGAARDRRGPEQLERRDKPAWRKG
jgi:hypothetical protein